MSSIRNSHPPSTFCRLLRRLLVAFVILGPSSVSSAAEVGPVAFGTLTPCYRSTQLQGHLFGMGLMKVPTYLSQPDLAFPYEQKTGFSIEVPFVDSFSINRFLGGYREDWLARFHLIDPKLGRRSLDYAIRGADGRLRFRPDLVRARLKPYIDAGYKPANITLALENVPWDLSSANGTAPVEGPWGRKTPPGDMAEWADVVRHLAEDLKAYLGPDAADITFETGVEYDERASFAGSAADFFRYYQTTGTALRSVLPGARFGPGEFTTLGQCTSGVDCVYDSRDLVQFARSHHLGPDVVPRSLHSLVDRGDPSPSSAGERFVESYSRLPKVKEEVHQFGLLFQPFGENAGDDVGPMQANWQFQTLMHLIAGGSPQRVFHWGGFTNVGKIPFLNGVGFLRLVLNHFLGRRLEFLPTGDQSFELSRGAETMAVALVGKSASAIIVSSFSKAQTEGSRTVRVTMPPRFLGSSAHLKSVTYRMGADVFSTIKRDLQADKNLQPEFLLCRACVAAPAQMAIDVGRGNAMINRNASLYEAKIVEGLRWQVADVGYTPSNGTLDLQMTANDLVVLESF